MGAAEQQSSTELAKREHSARGRHRAGGNSRFWDAQGQHVTAQRGRKQ